MGLGPAGHACERDAAADDVAELAVGKILRLRRAQVGNSRVEIAADVGLAGAVRGVADGAAVDVTFARVFQNLWRGLPGVRLKARLSRDGEIARGSSNDSFEARRLGRGGEAVQEDAHSIIGRDNKYHSYQEKNDFPEFHAEPLL